MDNKRITGPEQSHSFLSYVKKNSKKIVIRSNRKSEEIRNVYIKTDVISQAKGSAYMELGNTKVIVSVFDPREIVNKNEYSLKGELFCEFKFAPFSCAKRRNPQIDSLEKEYSLIFKQALESAVYRQEFPNFQVDIFALILENDGSALSAAISTAGIALAQAGIPMYDLISSTTVGLHGDQIFVDPTLEEEEFCSIPSDQQKLNYRHLKLSVESQVITYSEWTKQQLKNLQSEEKMEIDLNEFDTEKKTSDVTELSESTNKLLKLIEGDEKVNDDEEITIQDNILEHGILTLSMLQNNKQITEFHQTGSMSTDTLKKLTEILIEKNNEWTPLINSCLIKYVNSNINKEEIKKYIKCNYFS